ncbi:dephospho-CoA kinase [Candidatus Pelagibacter communis]|uniref:dephospho-CoA kinase n=1 Tax=Pelagibacter ubique TaxID=198252 RepID=UPI00092D2358|nr:dephospho-CoA kinase [Candidatus Pelagibacter ubique]
MIRIGILGEIGSGKSFVAKVFGHPVFNADYEVSKLYKKDKKIFIKLNKKLPKYISKFPIDKNEITVAILSNKNNLKKIITIVHKEIKKKMKLFLKKNKSKKIVILDIPLLLENKINIKKDILIFVDSKKKDIEKRLIKRKNFDQKLFNKFKKIQLSSSYKKKKSHFVIKNDFKKQSVKNEIKNILKKIL